jgi:hypothetical protein
MGNARRVKKIQKEDKTINEEQLKALVEECKAEYPGVPDIFLHMACIDYLMPKGKGPTINFEEMKKEILEQKGSINIE